MPLIPITISLVLGIIFAAQLPFQWALLFAPAPIGIVWSYCFLRKRPHATVERIFQVSLWMTFSLTGILMYQFSTTQAGNHVSQLEGKKGLVVALAKEDSRTTAFGKKVVLECEELVDGKQAVSGLVMTYLPADAPDVRQGERIVLEMKFKPLRTKFEGYRKYLHNRGIFTAANGRDIQSKGLVNSPLAWGGQLRRELKSRILELMPDPEIGGLAVAMLLGDKSGLNSEFRESFSASGLSHILAISGLHVGIIFYFIQQMLRFLALSVWGKRLQTLIAIGLLVIYMVMTGCAPAVCRAVLMIGLLELGKLFFQQSKGLNTLAVAGFILVLIRPATVFEIGFQLSFSAVAGIMVVAPRIQAWFAMRWAWGKDGMVSAASVCLAAQVFTAPLVWYHFGTFPTYFLFANLLLLPLVTFVVSLGFLAVISIWIPFLNQVLLGMLDFCLWVLTRLSGHISQWPGATVERLSFSDPGFCILMGMVLAGILFWKHETLGKWIGRRTKTRPNLMEAG